MRIVSSTDATVLKQRGKSDARSPAAGKPLEILMTGLGELSNTDREGGVETLISTGLSDS
jgi:hypothetical protein